MTSANIARIVRQESDNTVQNGVYNGQDRLQGREHLTNNRDNHGHKGLAIRLYHIQQLLSEINVYLVRGTHWTNTCQIHGHTDPT
uniref:Uncharacterized protein n=1 Tax=Thermogemmatispora argillosa TaxID=2045280 RepID=A0A455SYY9_9CHLR|nr:hypothetical protein KTA_10150 [Thermogemmatispora argillosa]